MSLMVNQEIHPGLGVTVYGTSSIAILPDIATVQFSIDVMEDVAKQAFLVVRELAGNVNDYLMDMEINDVVTTRVNLLESTKWIHNENVILGYRASMSYTVTIQSIEQIEDILIGLLDVGISKLGSISYATSNFTELKAEARKRAVLAAREKAEIYCLAANAKVGRIVHLEDMNSSGLRTMRHQRDTNADSMATTDYMEQSRAKKSISVGDVSVSAGVMVTYEILQDET